MWIDHPFSQRNWTTEGRVGVGGWKWQGSGEEVGQNLKKGEVVVVGQGGTSSGNRGIGTPLPTMLRVRDFKNFPFQLIKPIPHSWIPPISSKNFPSPNYSHFWKIPPSLLMKGSPEYIICLLSLLLFYSVNILKYSEFQNHF